MDYRTVVFSGHAIRRMFERSLRKTLVIDVLRSGETIADYPDDSPYPSRLLLGYPEGKPLHVVAALDPIQATCYVITVYEPDPAQWNPDFKTRRSP